MKKKYLIILFLGFMSFLYAKEPQVFGNNPNLPTIAIITTGGTIVEKTDPLTGVSVPAKSTDIIKNVPKLLEIVNVRLIEFSNIDSSQMTPQIWAKLSQVVDSVLKDRKIQGAVIAHGTDTMVEGAFFLDLTLKSNKPVVFTGAMRNSSSPFSDGPFNLINAAAQVISKNAKNWGVTVSLNQFINSARDVIKTNTTNPQTFESGERGYLGTIFGKQVYRLNNRLYRHKFPIPKRFPTISIFIEYPGAGPEVLRFLADSGSDIIIIEGFGAGNVSAQVNEGITYALKKNVIIILTTSVPSGNVFAIYGDVGGGAELKKKGVIISRYLRSQKARLLAMVAFPYFGRDKEKLKDLFSNP